MSSTVSANDASSSSVSAIQAAVEAVQSAKMSYRQGAATFGVGRNTIHKHLHKLVTHSSAGRPPVLSFLEETIIVRCCLALASFGYPANRDIVGLVISEYLHGSGRSNPFPDGKPGRKWWSGFLQRWKELSERKPEHLTVQRASAATPVVIDTFFSHLEDLLVKESVLDQCYSEIARRMWNCDETGLSTSVASRKVICRRGDRVVSEIGTGSGRDNITVLACGSAIGEVIPPYVVYKAQTLDTAWMKDGPVNARYTVSDSGWMEEAQFTEWFQSLFLPATATIRETGLVVLFFDGHGSHINVDIVTRARRENVILYCLPPHTTHILQPLDVSVFSAVKKGWSRILKEYKTMVSDAAVTKQSFPPLLCRLWQESLKPEYLVSGFRATGLQPLNRKAIKNDKLQTAVSFHGDFNSEAEATATPITKKVTSIFKEHFQAKQLAKKPSKDRLKPEYYGQSITTDDALKMLEKREEERKMRKEKKDQGKTKRGKSKRVATKEAGYHHPENTCQGCKGHYDNDNSEDQECWVGCDTRGCWRWYHYWCAGLAQLPDPNSYWSCPNCLKQ